jgi:2-isopropylmalate synthase
LVWQSQIVWLQSKLGARQVECTINGIGERAGNASLEEIVMALRVRADRLPFATRLIRSSFIQQASCSRRLLVSTFSRISDRRTKCFAHEAGIHQHGVINNPLCYEIMTPESVGVPPIRCARKAFGPSRVITSLRGVGF